MVVNESNVPLHKPLAVCLAALLACGAVSSNAHATDAAQRGKSAPEWTRAAVPGAATETVVVNDDEAPAIEDNDAELPVAFSRATATTAVDPAARAMAENGLSAFNAAQQSKFKASFDAGNSRVKMLYGSQSKKYANGAETVARGFLADAHALLGLQRNISDLKTLHVDETAEKNHVRFQQTYNGIPVVGAMVIVHSDNSGQVTMVQNGYIVGLKPANNDVVAEAAAKGIALDDLKATFNSGTPLSEGKAEKQIIRLNGKPYCIWKVSIPTKQPFGLWVFHVDAESGKILYKKNEIVALKTGNGKAFTSNANCLAGKSSSVSLKNMYTLKESSLYAGYLAGLYANIFTYDANNEWIKYGPYSSKYKYVYDPAANPDEFHATQAYYAVDTTRDWWKKNVIGKYGSHYTMDSSNPFFWSTPVVVNVSGLCNAYYTSDWLGQNVPGMVFGNENSCESGSADLVTDWDVVRHEYTHAMMDWTGFSGQFGGYVNYYGRAMGEGNADWFGYLQHPKESRMATVAFALEPGGYLRNLNNTRMYPDNVDYPGYGPEEHYTGEIWGGYLYDLYRVLGTGALKYVYQSFFYFDPSDGFMAGQPDFWDAIYAQIIAEGDITHKYTQSFKAWGDMASRGINGLLRPTYSSSDYFNTGVAGQDDGWYLYWGFPKNKTISTKGNMLTSYDTHEYIVKTYNSSMKLTATVTAEKNGLSNPIIGLYDSYGTQIVVPVSSSNGKSVTLNYSGLTPNTYVIRVTGQTATPAHGYYGFKVSIN